MTDLSVTGTAGRAAALFVYGLYLLSIPSAGVFALVGVVLAYFTRGDAEGVGRAHLDDAIRVWWVAFWWGVAIALIAGLGWLLAFVLIGFPIIWIACALAFLVAVWFTIKSLFGLLKLLDGRAPR